MIDTVQLEPHTCTARRHNVNCFETTVHQGCNQTAFYPPEHVEHVITSFFHIIIVLMPIYSRLLRQQ